MSRSADVLSRRMRVIGWICVVGTTLVILEMATVIPYLPESWWHPPDESPGRIDLRRMGVMHPGLLGWVGAWGYLAAWIWIPVALWRAAQARRRQQRLRPEERVLLAVVPILVLIVQGLLRLTPLRYEYPLV